MFKQGVSTYNTLYSQNDKMLKYMHLNKTLNSKLKYRGSKGSPLWNMNRFSAMAKASVSLHCTVVVYHRNDYWQPRLTSIPWGLSTYHKLPNSIKLSQGMRKGRRQGGEVGGQTWQERREEEKKKVLITWRSESDSQKLRQTLISSETSEEASRWGLARSESIMHSRAMFPVSVALACLQRYIRQDWACDLLKGLLNVTMMIQSS